MTWNLRLLLTFILFFQMTTFPKTFLQNYETLTLEEAKQRYGVQSFKPSLFKNGTTETRSKIAVTIITTKAYLGNTPDVVIEELGTSTGFFWNDSIPAYLLEENGNQDQHPWQLVFLLNPKGTISEVKIMRNKLLKK